MTDPLAADLQSAALLEAWERYSAACQAMFERYEGGSPMNAGGAMPFELFAPWKDFAEHLGMPSDYLAAGAPFKPEDTFANLWPALGLSREHQEIGRRMWELAGQFQRRYAEFAQHGADIGKSAVESFQKRVADGEPASNAPAALYDAWVDSAEDAYAGAAHSESFATLLADICNIVSAFKVERGKLLESLARQLDWPSRAEVDSLHRRVMELTAAAKTAAAEKTAAAPKAREPRASGGAASRGKASGKASGGAVSRGKAPRRRKRGAR